MKEPNGKQNRWSQARRDALVTENTGLAFMLAGRWAGVSGVPFDDLQQEAMAALVRAARGFNVRRARFSTYAWRAINNNLLRYVEKWSRAVPDCPDEFDPRDLRGERRREVLADFAARVDLDCLSDRERRIIASRYGLFGERRRTLDEMVIPFGLHRSRISQIEIEAIEKLREAARPRMAG